MALVKHVTDGFIINHKLDQCVELNLPEQWWGDYGAKKVYLEFHLRF